MESFLGFKAPNLADHGDFRFSLEILYLFRVTV